MRYELDDETKQLVEGVLELAQRMVDLQIDDAVADDLQAALVVVADRFGIATHEVANDREPTQDLKNTKPNFTVVDGGLPNGFTRTPDPEKD